MGNGRGAVLALLICANAACSSGSPSRSIVPPGAAAVTGGCGSTALYRDASPAWTRSAGPPDLTQATAHRGQVAAFMFGFPLRAGHPDNPANKILWVVRLPRHGSDLVLSGHPLGKSAPVVTVRQPADSGPGEIYPSIVDVPSPGCWQFVLRWNGHEDTIELPYR